MVRLARLRLGDRVLVRVELDELAEMRVHLRVERVEACESLLSFAMNDVKERVRSSRTRREMSSRPKIRVAKFSELTTVDSEIRSLQTIRWRPKVDSGRGARPSPSTRS